MIGSIRRECLDHLIVIDERHLRRILASYFDYYHRSRTHLSLGKDSPVPRPVESAKSGKIIAPSDWPPERWPPHHCGQQRHRSVGAFGHCA